MSSDPTAELPRERSSPCWAGSAIRDASPALSMTKIGRSAGGAAHAGYRGQELRIADGRHSRLDFERRGLLDADVRIMLQVGADALAQRIVVRV